MGCCGSRDKPAEQASVSKEDMLRKYVDDRLESNNSELPMSNRTTPPSNQIEQEVLLPNERKSHQPQQNFVEKYAEPQEPKPEPPKNLIEQPIYRLVADKPVLPPKIVQTPAQPSQPAPQKPRERSPSPEILSYSTFRDTTKDLERDDPADVLLLTPPHTKIERAIRRKVIPGKLNPMFLTLLTKRIRHGKRAPAVETSAVEAPATEVLLSRTAPIRRSQTRQVKEFDF